MKTKYALGLVFAVTAAAVVSIKAAEPGSSTIKSCASLLPEGHEFNVNLRADISTKSGAPTFHADLVVTDGSGTLPASFSDEQVYPFLGCVVELLE